MGNTIIALYYVSAALIPVSFIVVMYYIRLRIKADDLQQAHNTSVSAAIWLLVLLTSTVLFLLTLTLRQ